MTTFKKSDCGHFCEACARRDDRIKELQQDNERLLEIIKEMSDKARFSAPPLPEDFSACQKHYAIRAEVAVIGDMARLQKKEDNNHDT